MEFRGKLILAPLAGITDRPFRLLCRENGADVTVTEMVPAQGLLMQPARTARYLEYGEGERPVGAQLFGAIPEEMAEAAAEIRRLGFDFVDINMGGPVRKVTAGGAGGGPLSPPPLAGKIVKAAVDAAGIPVTVKIRSGFGTEPDSYLPVASEVFGAGAAAVTLHPRTRGQMFSGTADWGQIERLKREFPDRVVIGNGDVRQPEDSWGVASGGGGGAPGTPDGPSPEARRTLILRHGEEMHRRHGEGGIREMRKHLAWYSRGIPGASAFRGHLVTVRTCDDFRSAVERFF